VSKYDGVLIEVTNFEKYNPRGDAKRPTWFRVDNDLALGSGFFELDTEIKWLWIVILSLASKKNGQPFTWSSSYVQANTKIGPKRQDEALDLFEKFGRLRVSREVTLRGPQDLVRDSHATNERTNERTRGASASALPRLAQIWNDFSDCLPKVKGCSKSRKQKAESRWQEKPDEAYWQEIVRRMAASPFCRGVNERKWEADFDFLLQPDTQHKVLEGKYDPRGPVAPPTRLVTSVSELVPQPKSWDQVCADMQTSGQQEARA
jgi:hypothetical protein